MSVDEKKAEYQGVEKKWFDKYIYFYYYSDGRIKHDFLHLVWQVYALSSISRMRAVKKSSHHSNYSLEFTIHGTKRIRSWIDIVF